MARKLGVLAVLLALAAVIVLIARRRASTPMGETASFARPSAADRDRLLDEESEESFPASDAPSHWAGGVD